MEHAPFADDLALKNMARDSLGNSEWPTLELREFTTHVVH